VAGITAAASTTSHAASGATATASGFICGEVITLTATPTGTDYAWSLSLPSGSSAGRVGFAGDDEAAATFTPDVDGTYTVTVDVDGTVYTLTLSAVNLAVTNSVQGVRLSPVADAQIPTPAAGATVYWSSTQDALALKDSSGDVFTVGVTAV
jgi:hypothetical protein